MTENSVVAVYHTHTEADQAVKELQRGGVDMHKLSIVGKGYHTDEQVVGYYNAGEYKHCCFAQRAASAEVSAMSAELTGLSGVFSYAYTLIT